MRAIRSYGQSYVKANRMSNGNDTSVDAAVKQELEKSHQALSDAKKSHDAGVSDGAVINRLYYASFHAAQAVLYDRGYEPSSHGGVLSLFGSEIIAAGDMNREHGRFLNTLSELRKQADYGYEELDENVNEFLSQTDEFVSGIETLCSWSD